MVNEKEEKVAFSELPDLMTVQELADFLRCSTKVAYAMVRSGQISTIRVGTHQYRVTKKALGEYIGS